MMALQSVDERMARALELARAGRSAERRRDLTTALARYREARRTVEGLPPTPLLANILRWMGSAHRDLGASDDADRCYQESFEVAETTGAAGAQASALNCRAVMAQRRGDLTGAVGLYRRAARLAVEAGEIRLSGMIEQNLGVLANIRGDLDGALVRYRAALRAFQEVGDDEAVSWVLNNMGMLLNDLGQPARAEKVFLQALTLVRARKDRPMEGVLLANYSEGLIAMGRWDEAEKVIEDALSIARQGEDRVREAEALKFRGVMERERGAFAPAARALADGLRMARGADDPLLVAEILRERGDLRLREGDAPGAENDWQEALSGFEALDAHLDAAAVRTRLDTVARNRRGGGSGS